MTAAHAAVLAVSGLATLLTTISILLKRQDERVCRFANDTHPEDT